MNLMQSNILNDSHVVNKRRKSITSQNIKKRDIILLNSRTSKGKLKTFVKLKKKRSQRSKDKYLEVRASLKSQNNKYKIYGKLKNNLDNILKREKSADNLKKKSSLRKKIHNYFYEVRYNDTNYNSNQHFLKKYKKNNTLILLKKNKNDNIILLKRKKSCFSPDKHDIDNKNKFFKRLINLRTVSGPNLKHYDGCLYDNHNMNIYNDIKNTFNPKPKNKIKLKKFKLTEITKDNNNNYFNKEKMNNNILYFSHNNLLGFYSQKNKVKNRKIYPYKKGHNILYFESKMKKNKKRKNSFGHQSISLEKILVNMNTESKYSKKKVNSMRKEKFFKINVRKIDSISNLNTNNSMNFNLNKFEMEKRKKLKNNIDLFFYTEENKINKNININEERKNNEPTIDDGEIMKDNLKINDSQNNIKSILKEGKIIIKENFNNKCKAENLFHQNTSSNLQKKESKSKTPGKEYFSILKHFQYELISNKVMKNNIINSCDNYTSSMTYLYNILPGNNGKLVENVLKTRGNWSSINSNKYQSANLIWTPLSCQIDFPQHSVSEITQYVNHFEFHNELTNKANSFVNLFRYCEFNDIDLFSFYPLTIILSPIEDYLISQIEGFKKCYRDIPNLINTEKNEKFLEKKFYINYFYVNLSKKIGSLQKVKIPKTHYNGKNLWVIKRTNLNRGRQIKVLSNLDDIQKEINTMLDGKKSYNLIIQKYIEAPLLYCGRKFDIRIWVLFTYVGKDNMFEVYVFKEGHLKACSDLFNIDSDNLFIHLTNYSVQKHNKNFSKIEIGNEISFKMFQDELDKINSGKNFKKEIFPEIIKIIKITADSVKNKINIMDRKNCFEIFGYDFILDVEYQPYLLEINTNPGLEESSPLIRMLVPRMIDDAFRLTIDKIFENDDKNFQKAKFPVEGYGDDENMWLKIKKKKI